MERAVELDPKEARALNYLGYSLADRGKELARAESLIRRALAIDPDNGAYLDSLGWVLVKLERYPEAQEQLARAADLMAGDATVREHLGDLYMKQNDVERALAEWRTAQGLRPEDPTRLRRKILKATQDRK
jgi:Flp pilus assembly protein TadD